MCINYIMQTLLLNKNKILEIKKKVEEKDISLGKHIEIPNIPITVETISIIMTASNRSKQTYFTLRTIQNSSHKAIQVIIVDDSDKDPITREELEKFPFYINFISIDRQNKNWINPIVNYNIGFGYIQGSRVVIQNAEVCHVGDVLGYIGTQILDDNYYVCDIRASKSLDTNNLIYENNINSIDIYKNNKLFIKWWYQGKNRLVNYHFLSALTTQTFNKIKNFSYDYTMGLYYDDDDFLLKIIANNIKINNLFHDKYYFGGIHLWHSSSLRKIIRKIESNENIFIEKKEYYLKNKDYIDLL